MAVKVHGIDLKNPITLRAAALVAADGEDAAVFIGRGMFLLQLVWTACEAASGDEFYNVQLQYNTAAATSTWLDDINIAFGDTLLLGGAAETAATGDMVVGMFNPYDHQARTKNWVTGTIATGFNYAAYVYPINQAPF